MLKKRNAITLIALIITIIVLLILAGVVINMALGNDGIIAKAQSSVDKYQNAQEQEEIEIAKVANEIEGIMGVRDLASQTLGTAKDSDIASGKVAWVNGQEITGTAETILGPYVSAAIASYGENNTGTTRSTAISSNDNYFTASGIGDGLNYITITIKKKMHLKLIITPAQRGGYTNRKIAINGTDRETFNIYNETAIYEYDLENGDIVTVTQEKSSSVVSTSILALCTELK